MSDIWILALPFSIIPLLLLIWLFNILVDMIREIKLLVQEIRRK